MDLVLKITALYCVWSPHTVYVQQCMANTPGNNGMNSPSHTVYVMSDNKENMMEKNSLARQTHVNSSIIT